MPAHLERPKGTAREITEERQFREVGRRREAGQGRRRRLARLIIIIIAGQVIEVLPHLERQVSSLDSRGARCKTAAASAGRPL